MGEGKRRNSLSLPLSEVWDTFLAESSSLFPFSIPSNVKGRERETSIILLHPREGSHQRAVHRGRDDRRDIRRRRRTEEGDQVLGTEQNERMNSHKSWRRQTSSPVRPFHEKWPSRSFDILGILGPGTGIEMEKKRSLVTRERTIYCPFKNPFQVDGNHGGLR